MMAESWITSVTELLHIFREGLVALLPAMQKAHIPWQEGDAYDDWDEIAQALYTNIVARSLAHAFEEELNLDSVLPRYNTIHDSYSNVSLLEVRIGDTTGFFVGLSTSKEPFDTVDFISIDSTGRPIKKNCEHARLTDAVFRFRPGSPHGGKSVDELIVNL